MVAKKSKFLRRAWYKYSKLGRGRKKKQTWRKPTGRDNKMREKKNGHAAVVSVGYKKDKKDSGSIKGKSPVMIKNLADLEKVKNNEIVIVGNVGKKRKLEIAKLAKEKKIEIYNLNAKNYLKKTKIPKKEKKIIVKNQEEKTKSKKDQKKEAKSK